MDTGVDRPDLEVASSLLGAEAFEQRNVHELVAPYASTDYVMKGKVKIKDKSDTNADRYGDDARQWAVRLAWDLCLRACSKTHAPVFRVCRVCLATHRSVFMDGLIHSYLDRPR